MSGAFAFRVGQSGRIRLRVAIVVLLALVLSVLPAAGGQFEVLAFPVTTTDEVSVPLPELGGLRAAGDARDTVRAAADEWVATEAVESSMPFSMIGFELPDGVDELRVRTSADGDDWSEWVVVARVDAADGPDAGTEEGDADRSRSFTEPVWAEEANYFQVELPADARPEGELEAEVIDSVGLGGQGVEKQVVRTQPEANASGKPDIISRRRWGAAAPNGKASYASGGVHMGVVHHTATSNSYSDPRAVMRSMQSYHMGMGWKDLGYNIVIDREGRIYEGREGGLQNGVIGAHARGYNTGSFGVSVIGNYTNVNPTSATLQALEDVLSWQSSVYGIDPLGTTTQVGSGSKIATVIGHQQVGQTSCPGRIQNYLWGLREAAAANQVDFPDVAGAHREAVLALADEGVINGCASNRYCPGRDLTRGQMATIMKNALGLTEASSAQRFSDVPRSSAHRAGIHALYEADIVDGYDDGTFRPHEKVSRGQMAKFLTNGQQLSTSSYRARFLDVLPLHTHVRSIEAVARAGITNGCNNSGTRYCPGQTLPRDQAASLVHRALDG